MMGKDDESVRAGDSNSAKMSADGETTSEELTKQKIQRLEAEASEELKMLLQLPAPSQPDVTLFEEHRQRHPGSAELLQQMQQLLETKLYHEFTLAALAYLAPLAFAGSLPPSARAGPAAAAAQLRFTLPAVAEEFSEFERVVFFRKIVVPVRSKLDPSLFLRFLSAVLEDLEPSDALLFLYQIPLTSGGERSAVFGETGLGASTVFPRFSSSMTSSSSTLGSASAAAASAAASAAAREAELLYKSCESYHLSRVGMRSESEEILDELQKKINASLGVAPAAQAAFHRAAATLAKAQEKHAEFYHHAMVFLAYSSPASIPEHERVGLAYEIAIAALIAPDIFNFGELLQHGGVLVSLKEQPEHRWLYDLLEAFHRGSMAKFDAVCSYAAAQIEATALGSHLPDLRRKISMAALLRLAFTRSAARTAVNSNGTTSSSYTNISEEGLVNADSVEEDAEAGGGDLKKTFGAPAATEPQSSTAVSRSLSFNAIATACRVRADEVELLVMSAMCKKLLRGCIDQVKRQVIISWVRPALLLDEAGTGCLQERLLRWVGAAQQLQQHLQNQTAELLGS